MIKQSNSSVENKKIIQNIKTENKHIVRGSLKKDDPLLIINKISKRFGDLKALNRISFEIQKNERIGLIGGNGAGKTTLTEIIVGINKPSSGKIHYGFKFQDSPKEKIGMQFQQSNYPSGLTVKDMIKFSINLRKIKMSEEELHDILDIFQMSDFYLRKAKSLSGGQKQKLNILMSIIHSPELIVLDELSTGLDIAAREEIISFTDKLLTKNEMSAIIISHHMSEIKSLCKKVVVLDKGEVKEIALISDIEKKHGSLNSFVKKHIVDGYKKVSKNKKKVIKNNVFKKIVKKGNK